MRRPLPRFGLDTALSLLLCGAGLVAAMTLVLLMSACANEDGRGAELRTLFIDQDRELAAERPDWVAAKYAEMSSTPYAYLRGSAVVFYRDATAFTGDPAIARVDGADAIPLFCDLHLENLGAVPAGAMTVLDVTDFDSSVSGPFDWDLRRAAMGLAALDGLRMGHDPHGDAATIAPLVTAFVDAYARGLGEAPASIERAELGAITTAALDNGDAKLAAREELSKYTSVDGETRTILRTAELVHIATPWDRGLPDAIAAWSTTRRAGPLSPASLVVKDVARRLGAGVASLSSHRFYVLLEGSAGVADDLLLELKEERDPPVPAELLGRGAIVDGRTPGTLPSDNAARVLVGATRLLASNAAEPDFGRTVWNGVPFFVRSTNRARENLDTTGIARDLDRGKLDENDLAALASDLGRVLGRAHAHAGSTTSTLIRTMLTSTVREQIVTRAVRDAATLADDRARFTALLDRYGPLLGPPEPR